MFIAMINTINVTNCGHSLKVTLTQSSNFTSQCSVMRIMEQRRHIAMVSTQAYTSPMKKPDKMPNRFLCVSLFVFYIFPIRLHTKPIPDVAGSS